MGEDLVLCVDRLSDLREAQLAVLEPSSAGEEESPPLTAETTEDSAGEDEDQPLIDGGECRICQEEDSVANLETPCGCSGSLKYAHRKCVQRWCNEKGDIICEICHQTYHPGYTAPPPPSPHADEAAIDIGAAWAISGAPYDLHNPHFLAIAQVERPFLEADYEDYAASGARAAAFCRSAILIMMALLFLRHAWIVSDDDDDDDMSAFLSPLAARAVGFLLPCYIITWAIDILHQRRRQGVYRKSRRNRCSRACKPWRCHVLHVHTETHTDSFSDTDHILAATMYTARFSNGGELKTINTDMNNKPCIGTTEPPPRCRSKCGQPYLYEQSHCFASHLASFIPN